MSEIGFLAPNQKHKFSKNKRDILLPEFKEISLKSWSFYEW